MARWRNGTEGRVCRRVSEFESESECMRDVEGCELRTENVKSEAVRFLWRLVF